jgi:hypothetical protein
MGCSEDFGRASVWQRGSRNVEPTLAFSSRKIMNPNKIRHAVRRVVSPLAFFRRVVNRLVGREIVHSKGIGNVVDPSGSFFGPRPKLHKQLS